MLLVAAGLLPGPLLPAQQPPQDFPPQPAPPFLSPAEELKTIQLQDGYQLELVLSEPEVREPVLCVFDGNGRMYVAEMRTYMQDIDGTNSFHPVSRVSRHESSRRDDRFDKHTVFADQLLLPRMVLPLQKDQAVIGVTNSASFSIYSDSNHDGVSDATTLFYEGGAISSNMEHQQSGLYWAMDNWIYTTYNAYRLRWTPAGTAVKESTPANGGQWGITQDDFGKLWWSNAGAEKGLLNFQMPILYGGISLKGEYDQGFMEVWPAIGLADFQGGPGRARPDKTLNHFTACGGQEVYRGDRLPRALYGNVILPEPVGRLIRLAEVRDDNGITRIRNPYQEQKSEFIRSTDPYFRPVSATMGPDGCIYIVDMYRGIIQEGNWVKEGSYLRKVVKQYSMDKNIGAGRIWRLTHRDFKPGPAPKMYEETSAQLVSHLSHPNGWWRDQAQKLLVLRQDKSVLPLLVELIEKDRDERVRVQAMWTLEGLGGIDAKLISAKLKDPSPHVRTAAIRISETLFKAGDNQLKPEILALKKDPAPEVVLQAMGTMKRLGWSTWQTAGPDWIASSSSAGVRQIGKELLYSPKKFDGKLFSKVEIQRLEKGQEIFQQTCFACHGLDGRGMPMEGQPPGTTLAPPLAGSKSVLGRHEGIVALILHGATGPIQNKTYEAQMPPMGGNDDEWVASITSYLRNAFGNGASAVSPEQVAQVRTRTNGRTQPWSHEELKQFVPQPFTDTKGWKVSAQVQSELAPLAIDGNTSTCFSTKDPQVAGQWYQVEFPDTLEIAGVTLQASESSAFPRGYKTELSTDGVNWQVVAEGKGTGLITEITFPPAGARFLRITQTGAEKGKFWSIGELQVMRPQQTSSTLAGTP